MLFYAGKIRKEGDVGVPPVRQYQRECEDLPAVQDCQKGHLTSRWTHHKHCCRLLPTSPASVRTLFATMFMTQESRQWWGRQRTVESNPSGSESARGASGGKRAFLKLGLCKYIGWSHFIPMHLALLRGPRPGVLSRLAWHMDRAIALDLMAELVASP
jgi:hypothetical protein